ncbi:MAG: TonB-dependent receptor [Gemmatimonadales bacterium]
MTPTRAHAVPLVLLLIGATAAAAQDRGGAGAAGIVAGTVVDSGSGRPLSQVAVDLSPGGQRTMTDQAGRFTLRAVPAGQHTLTLRRIGFTPVTRDGLVVPDSQTRSLRLSMQAAAVRLADVTVVPGSFSFLDAGATSRQTVSRARIETAPFGEDVFRAVNRLPGLASGDYGAHFSIRGGRQDETLIQLDGLEIYEPFHLKDFDGGALSIIDVDAIDGVELLTGGFPALYGDKRSGVMNITSRTATKDGTRLTAGASFSNIHALGEGSFASQKGSWLLSGRRGFVDLVLGIINKKETQAPSYEDLFGTVRYQVSPNHNLALSLLHAGDRYRFAISGTTGFNDSIRTTEAANNSYGNTYAWLTLKSLLGPKLAVRTLASVGTVTARRSGNEQHLLRPLELYSVEGKRDFSLVGIKQDYRLEASNRLVLDWGFDVRSLDATYDWINRVTQNPDDPTPDTTGYYPRITRRAKNTSGRTFGAYLSNRLQVAEPLTLELGLRYDKATYTGDRDWSPRLHGLVRLSETNTLRAGWGVYRQRQGIADENAFDRLNRYFPAEDSRQWTVGFEHRYPRGGAFRAEAYHKTGTRLRPILRNWKSGLNVFPESAEDRILVYPDSTRSKGIELYHEGDIGRKLSLRAAYSFAEVREFVSKIEQVNDPLVPPFNRSHPGPTDQRHALNVDVSYRLGRSWTVAAAHTFHTGWPYTPEKGVTVTRRNGTTDLAVRPDSLYAGRLPSYLRTDVRLTRRVLSPRGEFRFFVEVINLTNHENVLGYDVFRVRNPAGALVLESAPETWFSILPSLGVSWTRRF